MHMRVILSLVPSAGSCFQARYNLPHVVAAVIQGGTGRDTRSCVRLQLVLALSLSIDAVVAVGADAADVTRGVAPPLEAWLAVMRWKMVTL